MEATKPEAAAGGEPEEGTLHLLIVYTRDWIHYGALAFYFLVTLAAAVRGLLSR